MYSNQATKTRRWRLPIRVRWACWAALVVTASGAVEGAGSGFENGLAGWKQLWTRESGAGVCAIDQQVFHTGRQSARIAHRGERDWSFEPEQRMPVRVGDVFEMEVWLKLEGKGSATLCVATVNAEGKTLAWIYGGRTATEKPGWFKLTTRFVVPPEVAQIQPRLIGTGAATIWVDDFEVSKKGNIASQRKEELPSSLGLTNAALRITLFTPDGTCSVEDRRTSQEWLQKPFSADVAVTDAKCGSGEIRLQMLHLVSGLPFTATIRLDSDLPEFVVEVHGAGELPSSLSFPHPFIGVPGQDLIVPMNEGISYPVADPSIEPMHLIAYGGHGICMAFWGVTDGSRGHMAIIETPDDAAIRIDRIAGNLTIAPEWQGQKGEFGYSRRLRYVFFDAGGYVTMCKRYRSYARQIGIFKTLAEKRNLNANIDLLVGAANVWYWDKDPLSLVREMKTNGIDRILWSNRQSPDGIRAMNELGILTSRYDIYQDLMDPAKFPILSWVHPDWTTEGWPKDIIIGADGKWIHGWEIETKDGQRYPCGVLCDRVAPDYARRRISAELATHPYRCRFIDTTTASPWRECFAPGHALTRGESRQWKMELLRVVSADYKLVTGCETGHDAAVPHVDYLEGMLSLGPYRVPDSGRNMQRIWNEVPDAVAKFQLGHKYRLPLWELVFHDCVVAQWYWGDYNNKLPVLWDKRDLLNALYGTPAMFMFDRAFWAKNKERFVQSYRAACTVARATGYSEMLDHRYLTADREVQQTRFANGVTVTVNFGTAPFALSPKVSVPAASSWVAGIESALPIR